MVSLKVLFALAGLYYTHTLVSPTFRDTNMSLTNVLNAISPMAKLASGRNDYYGESTFRDMTDPASSLLISDC